jgi:hypothetical protein
MEVCIAMLVLNPFRYPALRSLLPLVLLSMPMLGQSLPQDHNPTTIATGSDPVAVALNGSRHRGASGAVIPVTKKPKPKGICNWLSLLEPWPDRRHNQEGAPVWQSTQSE